MDKARECQKNIYFCFIEYTKDFDCVDQNKLWNILKEMGLSDHLSCLPRNLNVGQGVAVRTLQVTTYWFNIGKGLQKAIYYHPAYLTYMQSTSWEMPGYLNHKLESRLPGEKISTTSDMYIISL